MADERQESQDETPESVHIPEADIWVYGELIRIEQHWTDQVQNQQRRITAVLAVNGFLLAFLAAAGFQVTSRALRGWYLYPFYLSLIFLSGALVFGILTLLPRIPVTGGVAGSKRWFHDNLIASTPKKRPELWLDSQHVLDEFRRARKTRDFDDYMRQMCDSVASNACGNLEHQYTVFRRRRWMHWQIGLIMLSLALLIVAVIGLAVHVL
jgi:hypothetical protein